MQLVRLIQLIILMHTFYTITHMRIFFCLFVYLIYEDWNWCGKVYGIFNASPVLPHTLFSLSCSQLCVQKLRILIEDSDQNCEPSVNACSVSFSHCLRVSVCGTACPF